MISVLVSEDGMLDRSMWLLPCALLQVFALGNSGLLEPGEDGRHDDTAVDSPGIRTSSVQIAHLARNGFDEEESALDAMDKNRDRLISGAELESAIQTGHIADAARNPASLPPGRTSARFFLSPTSRSAGSIQDLKDVRVSAVDPSIATASFSLMPAGAEGRRNARSRLPEAARRFSGAFLQETFERNLAAELLVECACHAPGTARFRVDLPSSRKVSRSPAFVFSKSCQGLQLQGFNVGSTPEGKDALENGQPIWQPSNAPVLAFNEHSVDLFISASSTLLPEDVEFQAPRVRVWQHKESPSRQRQPSSGALHRDQPAVQASIDSDLASGSGKLSPYAPTKLTVSTECLKPSAALIEVILAPKSAWDPYRPVSIFLKKQCNRGALIGFNVGTAHGVADLVRDGQVLADSVDGALDADGSQESSQIFVEYPKDKDSSAALVPIMRCADESQDGASPAATAQLSVPSDGSGYTIRYKCHRPGISSCSIRLGLPFWDAAELRWRKTCVSAGPDITIQSNRFQSMVFGGRQAASMWAPENPGVVLAPNDNVAVFTVRASHLPPKGPRSEVRVSDTSVVDAIVSVEPEGAREATAPLVLVARNVCKKHGTAKVSISLHVGEASSGPVEFAYWKACNLPEAKGLAFLAVRAATTWDIPRGGWRTVLFCAIAFAVAIVLYECAQFWMSRRLKDIMERTGTECFGVKIEIESLNVRPWTGSFKMTNLIIRNPPGYEGDYLMKAKEYTFLFATKRMVFSLGGHVEIRQVRLKHIDLQIENPTLMGTSNLFQVKENAAHSHATHTAEQTRLQMEGVADSRLSKIVGTLTAKAILDVAEFQDISTTVTHTVGGLEAYVDDVLFKNFSMTQNPKAIGVRSIANKLIQAFIDNILEQVFGQFGASLVHTMQSEK